MPTKRGKFKYLLGIDCETTGLCFSNDSPIHNPNTGETHQTVSWGALVIESESLEVVEEAYVEIQWNELSCDQREDDPKFGTFAEKVHGLSKDYLDQNGMPEEEACLILGTMVNKYWSPKTSIVTMGHNVHTFDMPFFRDMFRRQGIELRLNNRHVDTNSIAYANWETFNSDDMFELLGFEDRKDHNALEDIKQTLQALVVSRTIMSSNVAQQVLQALKP
jgi:hypothetical protein